MSALSQNILQISISSDPENGLAEMMSGYLEHFGAGQVATSLLPSERKTPTVVLELLKEDGIHAYHGQAKPSATSDIAVELNDFKNSRSVKANVHRYYRVAIPETTDKEKWRTTREALKVLAIELLGELQSKAK